MIITKGVLTALLHSTFTRKCYEIIDTAIKYNFIRYSSKRGLRITIFHNGSKNKKKNLIGTIFILNFNYFCSNAQPSLCQTTTDLLLLPSSSLHTICRTHKRIKCHNQLVFTMLQIAYTKIAG